MAQYFEVHPHNPQARLLKQATALLQQGQVLAIPTDSSYALVCVLDDKSAVDRIRQIRGVDDKHLLTLICKDLSELASYAKVDNRQFRLLKQATPGPFTFVLEASKEVPRRVSHPQRKTIGLRVPDYAVVRELLGLLDAPLLASTLILPGDDMPMSEPSEIRDRLDKEIGGVIDAGSVAAKPTTVLDLTTMDGGGDASVLRAGQGDWTKLGLSI